MLSKIQNRAKKCSSRFRNQPVLQKRIRTQETTKFIPKMIQAHTQTNIAACTFVVLQDTTQFQDLYCPGSYVPTRNYPKIFIKVSTQIGDLSSHYQVELPLTKCIRRSGTKMLYQCHQKVLDSDKSKYFAYFDTNLFRHTVSGDLNAIYWCCRRCYCRLSSKTQLIMFVF